MILFSMEHEGAKNKNHTNIINKEITLFVTLLRENYLTEHHETLYVQGFTVVRIQKSIVRYF